MNAETLNKTNTSIIRIREQADTALLFCSFGKDSLVLLDLLAAKFDKVLCIFMYFVKDLEHINKYARWVSAKYANVEVEQIPHWSLSYLLRSGMFCTYNKNVKLLKFKEVDKAMKLKYGVDFSFYGMKKADSINRRVMLNQYGDTYEYKGKVYPLADWTQKDVMTYIKLQRIVEPVRYSKKSGGGVNFNIDCFLYLRENYPDDLEKIYRVFPASRKLLIDYDNKQIV